MGRRRLLRKSPWVAEARFRPGPFESVTPGGSHEADAGKRDGRRGPVAAKGAPRPGGQSCIKRRRHANPPPNKLKPASALTAEEL